MPDSARKTFRAIQSTKTPTYLRLASVGIALFALTEATFRPVDASAITMVGESPVTEPLSASETISPVAPLLPAIPEVPDPAIIQPNQDEAAATSSASPTLFEDGLTAEMQIALRHVARRYRVSAEALKPVFQAAQLAAGECTVDPLLIIAIIGVESSFNPFAESAMGALGLMQVMPQFQQDKLPPGAGNVHFLDPVINIQVGSHILEEAIRRNGGLLDGLQQFGGAINDSTKTYAKKVLAEKERLEQAIRNGGEAST